MLALAVVKQALLQDLGDGLRGGLLIGHAGLLGGIGGDVKGTPLTLSP